LLCWARNRAHPQAAIKGIRPALAERALLGAISRIAGIFLVVRDREALK